MQKRKTGIALLLIGALLLVPMVSALAGPLPANVLDVQLEGEPRTTSIIFTLDQRVPLSTVRVDVSAPDYGIDNAVESNDVVAINPDDSELSTIFKLPITKVNVPDGTEATVRIALSSHEIYNLEENRKVILKNDLKAVMITGITPVKDAGGTVTALTVTLDRPVDVTKENITYLYGYGWGGVRIEDMKISEEGFKTKVVDGETVVTIPVEGTEDVKEIELKIDKENYVIVPGDKDLYGRIDISGTEDTDLSIEEIDVEQLGGKEGKTTTTAVKATFLSEVNLSDLNNDDIKIFCYDINGDYIDGADLTINGTIIVEEGNRVTIPITGITQEIKKVGVLIIRDDIEYGGFTKVFFAEKNSNSENPTPSTPSTPTPTAPAEPEKGSLTDDATAITATGLLPKEAVGLEVTPKGKLYDVQLVDEKGNPVYTEELIWVEVPVPEDMTGDNLRVKVDGKYVTFERHGDKLVFASRFLAPGTKPENPVILKDTAGEAQVKGVELVGTTHSLPKDSHIIVKKKAGTLQYDIELLDANDNKISSNGPVMLHLPGEGISGDNTRVKVNGIYTTFEREASGGFAIPVQF